MHGQVVCVNVVAALVHNDLYCLENYNTCDVLSIRVTSLLHTGWRRCIECLIFIRHYPKKSSIIIGSFAERDLQVLRIFATL